MVALRADDVDIDRDRALVRRFQAGDDDAFDELYRRYHDRLERFCRKRVGDRYTAEEVTQEAFTRALTALPELGGDLRFYPWVSVIAARLCVDSLRRQSRSEPTSDPDPGPVTGGQEDIIEAVDVSLVVAALARLAPRHQDVLHLREVEGWSYQRIADHYSVKVGTVETLLFRARRALRREFKVVDGAGLAAIPVLRRLVEVAARFRHRVPSWLPSVSSPSSVAAAAGATAAAVALAVMPARAPVAPPAHRATPHRAVNQPVRVGAGAGGGVVMAGSPGQVVVPMSPTPAPSATSDSMAHPTAGSLSDDQVATSTTTVPPPPAGGGATNLGPGGSSGPATTPPLTLAPPDTVTLDLPPVARSPVPTLPPVSPGIASSARPILDPAQTAVNNVVGGLLPGGH